MYDELVLPSASVLDKPVTKKPRSKVTLKEFGSKVKRKHVGRILSVYFDEYRKATSTGAVPPSHAQTFVAVRRILWVFTLKAGNDPKEVDIDALVGRVENWIRWIGLNYGEIKKQRSFFCFGFMELSGDRFINSTWEWKMKGFPKHRVTRAKETERGRNGSGPSL